MTTAYSTNLELALPVQGELSGTWGDTVNNGITQYLDTAIAGSQIISGSQTAVTLSNTNGDASATNIAQVGSGSTGTAQYQIIRCTGNPASLLTITISDTGTAGYSKTFVIINATSTSQSVKIVGSGPTTGVTVLSGAKSLVAWNGSDFVEIASSTADGVTTFSAGTTGFTPSTATSGAVTLAGTLATTNGGTGLTSFTSGGAVYATSTSALATGTLPTTAGGTALTSFTANGVVYASSTSALATGSGLVFDGANLGLGVTPSAWISSGKAIDIAGFGSVAQTSSGSLASSFNAYQNSAANWIYKTTNPASQYQVGLTGTAAHAWFTAPSGTAGDAITFTQAMTLDASGKLLLGVTSGTGLSNSDFAMVNGGSIRFRNAANSAYLSMINVDSSNNLNFGVGGVPTNITFGISGIGEVSRYDSAGYLSGVWADKVTALGNSGTATTITCTSGNVFTATLTGNCTFTLSAPSTTTANTATSFTLILTNDGTAGRTVAFSGGTFKYPGGSVTRTTTANATDIWFFFSPNGGTTWYVSIPMANLS